MKRADARHDYRPRGDVLQPVAGGVEAHSRGTWTEVVIRRGALMLVGIATACQTLAPRYAVTATPIDVGGGLPSLCVAVDARDPHGVSWWLPGRTGCASRGSSVITADQATVSAQASTVTAGFGVETHGGNTVAVRLVIEGGEVRAPESGARASVERRHDLTMPELPPFGRRGGG